MLNTKLLNCTLLLPILFHCVKGLPSENPVNVKVITEKSLIESSRLGSPKLTEIKARLLGGQSRLLKVQDGFAPKAYGGYNHTTTNERAVIPFIPIYSPVNQYKSGITKQFKHGVNADLSATVDQRSGSSFDTAFRNIHTTIFDFTLNFDLWQNLFGKMSKLKIENAKINYEISKIKSLIEKKAYRVTIRRIYWSLVVNEEKIRISKRLLEQAKKQARDAMLRRKNSIADVGEVARYESQVASREGGLLLLKYQNEQLIKSLSDLVPDLSGKELKLGAYNIEKTVYEVLSCTQTINQKVSAPYEYTSYDELIKLMEQAQKNQGLLDQRYDDIDIKLRTSFRQIGVASEADGNNAFEGSFNDSIDDIRDNDRSAFEAGLQITIPLGDQKKTASVTEEYNKKATTASINATKLNIVNTHNQLKRQVRLLQDVIRTQKVNSKKLEIRLKDMKKKFNQARVSVSELIQDQDALLNSDLIIVDTQMQVLNTLFDYFSIFNDTPCSFNL